MKDFNNPDKVYAALKNVNADNYKFGLSTLHADIRTFEWFVHLGYKLELKPEWKAVGDANKKIVADRKKRSTERVLGGTRFNSRYAHTRIWIIQYRKYST